MSGEGDDNRGAGLVFSGEISPHVLGVQTAEAMALRTGLLWALDNLPGTGTMYTDAEEVYFAIKSLVDDWIEFGKGDVTPKIGY